MFLLCYSIKLFFVDPTLCLLHLLFVRIKLFNFKYSLYYIIMLYLLVFHVNTNLLIITTESLESKSNVNYILMT